MITRYIQHAMRRAAYRTLDDGQYFGEIPGLRGVWASARSRRACQKELQEVLEEWLLLKIRDHDQIPKIGGVSLTVKAA